MELETSRETEAVRVSGELKGGGEDVRVWLGSCWVEGLVRYFVLDRGCRSSASVKDGLDMLNSQLEIF